MIFLNILLPSPEVVEVVVVIVVIPIVVVIVVVVVAVVHFIIYLFPNYLTREHQFKIRDFTGSKFKIV